MTSEAVVSPDEVFGKAVSQVRQAREWSQKELATRLTAAGMRVDAPAVSRIESGARSVRLSEALKISEVLDVELEDLVSAADNSPTGVLRRMRRNADVAREVAREPLARFLARFTWVAEHLELHPELLSTLVDVDGVQPPTTVDEYFDWVVERLKRIRREEDERGDPKHDVEKFAYFASERAREGAIRLVGEYARLMFAPVSLLLESEGDDDGAPTNPAE